MYTIEIKDKYDKFCGYICYTDKEIDVINISELKRIQQECKGSVYTLNAFMEEIDRGFINSYDGIGYFHNGEKETEFCVWNDKLSWDDIKDFPYVCWYNK